MNNNLCLAISVAALLFMAQPPITQAAVYEVSATGKTEAAAEGNSRMNALRKCLTSMITPEKAKKHAMDLRPLFRKVNSLTSVEVLERGRQNNLETIRANVTVDENALRAELKAIPAFASIVTDAGQNQPGASQGGESPEQPASGQGQQETTGTPAAASNVENSGASTNQPENPDIQQPMQGGGEEIVQNNSGNSPTPDVPTANTSVENAIANALTAIHAKAEKVDFSAGEQSLVITGLEYGPLEKNQRKGRIEHIRLEGFDEKALLESGNESADLPRLAEKAVISRWTESSEKNGEKMVLNIESYTLQGWYWRLGALLKNSSPEDMGAFFAGLANFRLDGAHAENIRIESSKQNSSPKSVTVKSIEIPGGVPAPGADGRPRKANLLVRDIAFVSDNTTGTLDKFTVSGGLILHPAQITSLLKNLSDAGKATDGPEIAVKMIDDIFAGNPPFSLVSFENMKVRSTQTDDLSTLDSLSVAMDGSGNEAYKLNFSINALRLAPSALGKFKEKVMSSTPEGVVIDMQVNGSSAESGSDANASIKLRGLGSLEIGGAVNRDLLTLLKQMLVLKLANNPAEVKKLLSEIDVTNAKLAYEDSGLIPLVANLALECGNAIGLDGLNLALQYVKDQQLNTNFNAKGLRVGLELLEKYRTEIARFSPDGIVADASLGCALTKEGATSNSSVAARGLGNLKLDLSMKGDTLTLLEKAAKNPDNAGELTQMLPQIKLTSLSSAYGDSGLAAMILGIVAKQADVPPTAMLPIVLDKIEKSLVSSENAFYARLGGMLKEQLTNPGTMSVKLAPGTDIDVMTFGMTAAKNPDKLPLEFSSKPGSKNMEEYLK